MTIKTHKKYDELLYDWKLMRDAVEGESSIKRKNVLYLPMPGGMTLVDSIPDRTGNITENAPFYHKNQLYRSYLQRASFPDLVSPTVRGMVGVVTTIDPVLSGIEDDVKLTVDGLRLPELYAYLIEENLTVGRGGIFVDPNEQSGFLLAVYPTESIIDWEYGLVNSRKDLIRVDLKEGEFVRRLYLDGPNAIYTTVLFDEKGIEVPNSKVTPTKLGKTLNKIPFYPFSPIRNSLNSSVLPLLGVSNSCLAAYRISADLHQGIFLAGNPTPVLTGIQGESEKPKAFGSAVFITLSDPNAKATFLEPQGNSLELMRNYIREKKEEAIQQAVALFGRDKRAPESAEALRIKQQAGGSLLVSIVQQTAQALEDALKTGVGWDNDEGANVELEASYDFAEMQLSIQELESLVRSWSLGAISHETVLQAYHQAGIIEDVDEELDRVGTEGPSSGSTNDNDEEDASV